MSDTGRTLLRSVANRFLAVAFAAVEFAFTPRVFAVAYLLAAALLSVSPWLRPALSPDIGSLNLPLRIGAAEAPDADELLYGPRVVRTMSVGTAMLAVVAVCTAVVAWRPRWVGSAAGVVLAASIAANAVAALNFPALIERLDHEYEQRYQMADTLGYRRSMEDGMSNRENGRLGPTAVLVGGERRGDPWRGWVYLVYGTWLCGWAALGVLAGTRRSVPVRLLHLTAWSAAGVALGGAACQSRTRAELAWRDAVEREGRCDFDGAAAALERSASYFPELGRLERAWLLRGKIDYQLRLSTPAATSFRVFQLNRDKRRPRGVADAEDLPWTVHRTTNYAERGSLPPVGVDRTLESGALGTGTPDRRQPVDRWLQPPPGFYALMGRDKERDGARALLRGLLETSAANVPAVRHQAGRLVVNYGLDRYFGGEILDDVGRVYVSRSRGLIPAQDAWNRAAVIDPPRLDTSFYLGMSASKLDPDAPGPVVAAFEPLMKYSADLTFRADALSEIGDVELQAGQLPEARKYFAESFDLFNIPEQFKNYRAQRRLGGI